MWKSSMSCACCGDVILVVEKDLDHPMVTSFAFAVAAIGIGIGKYLAEYMIVGGGHGLDFCLYRLCSGSLCDVRVVTETAAEDVAIQTSTTNVVDVKAAMVCGKVCGQEKMRLSVVFDDVRLFCSLHALLAHMYRQPLVEVGHETVLYLSNLDDEGWET